MPGSRQPMGNYPPLVDMTEMLGRTISQSGPDVNAIMQMNEERERRRLQQEQRQRDAEDRATQMALQFAQNPDIDLKAVFPSIPNLTQRGAQLAEQIWKSGKRARKQQEILASSGAMLEGAAKVGAGRLDERGNVVVDPARASYAEELKKSALGDIGQERPGLVGTSEALFNLNRMLEEQNLSGQSADFKRSLAVNEEEEMMDAWTGRAAGASLGMIPNADIAQEIRDYYPEDQHAARLVEWKNNTMDRIVKMKMQVSLVPGKGPTADEMLARFYMDEFGAKSMGEGLAMARKQVFKDPATGRSMMGGAKQHEQRQALHELMVSVPTLGAAATRAAKAVSEEGAIAGPIVGAPSVQTLLRNLGTQNKHVAYYDSVYKIFTSKFLKATQGSRPSDFDLHFYLSLLPTLTELTIDPETGQLNGAAQMRIKAMTETMNRAAYAAFPESHPDVYKMGMAQRAIPKTAEDMDIEAMFGMYQDGDISMSEWDDALTEWKSKRGDVHRGKMMSSSKMPPKSAVERFRDQYERGGVSGAP